MTLRTDFLDAVIDGYFDNGIIARKSFIERFMHWNPKTTGCFLSNSEMNTGALHSPTYRHFTVRITKGKYRIHPQAIIERLAERAQSKAVRNEGIKGADI